MTLIVIYGQLSRYDEANGSIPFSGAAGDMFKHRTFDGLEPKPTSVQIRVVGTAIMAAPIPADARFLLLGSAALRHYRLDDNILKQRGLCLTVHGRPAVATFEPIECWDFKLQEEDEEAEEKEDAKDVGPTARSNYLHWAILDYIKLRDMPWPLPVELEIPPAIAPPMGLFISWLNSLPKYAIVTIDIENRRQDHSLDCIGFKSSYMTYVMPVYRYNNTLYYTPHETYKFWKTLAVFFLRKDIIVVGHNLAHDLGVLSIKYHLPIPVQLFDTMLAMSREYPQLEKSLSHALTRYTFAQRNHKADIAANVSNDNMIRLFNYNASDLIWTERIYKEQVRRAQKNEALADAIDIANHTLRTTLLMSNCGLRVDLDERERQRQMLLAAAEQYVRICRILTGVNDYNPGSTQQTAQFFYDRLKYPCEDFTETGARSTGAKTLYKLAVKQPNPLIPFILAAREASKAASMLEFRLREVNK